MNGNLASSRASFRKAGTASLEELMSGLVMDCSTLLKHTDLAASHKTHDKGTHCPPSCLQQCRPLAVRCTCSRSLGTYTCVPSVPLAVVPTLLDTVDAGCSSREKRSAATIKSESLSSFVPGTYSRKVFIGGLPPDLDAGTCTACPCMYVCCCVCCVCV